MGLEDLKEQDILLPEEEWGEHRLETTVPEIPVAVIFLLSAVGCVLTYIGDGNTLTWIGIVLFFIAFFGIVWICDRAVRKQRERFKKERRRNKKLP